MGSTFCKPTNRVNGGIRIEATVSAVFIIIVVSVVAEAAITAAFIIIVIKCKL